MKRILAAAAALLLAASAFAGPPPQGSTLLFPRTGAKPTIMRLPPQAGKVSQLIPTKLVAKSRSWIAKGDKYYSLCMPNRSQVACAPLVATRFMHDIDVDAGVDAAGEPMITFRVVPGTTQTPARLIYSMKYFLERTNKQAERLNRLAASNVPKPKTPPPMRPGPNPDSVATPDTIAIDISGCVSDDLGSLECTGGDSGGGEGYESAYEGDEYNEEWESAEPGSPNIPSFPPGPASGDADPCIDSSGNNVCQQVVITGERPQEMAMTNCIVTPWHISCGQRTPPVIGGIPVEELPRGPRPLFPQSACNFATLLCTEGQIPDASPPPLTDEEVRKQKLYACYKESDWQFAKCRALKKVFGWLWYEDCIGDATASMYECKMLYG